jgi:hypothetical protein
MEARLTSRRLLVCAAAIATLACVASGCGGGGNAQAAAKDPPLVTYSNSFLSFAHPQAWRVYPFRWAGELHFQPMLYLSTQPVHDPCRQKGNVTTCGWPVRRLRPNGVLVMWENRGFPGWRLDSQRGSSLRVGGRAARRSATNRGVCAAIGGDVTIQVAIARPVVDNWTEATACLRGPSLARSERALNALLASTKFLSE